MSDRRSRAGLPPGRSCEACRRRKIRCDRNQPCSYCLKLRAECIYESRAREARKPEDEVLARLNRIETILTGFDARVRACETGRAGSCTQKDNEHPQKHRRDDRLELERELSVSGDSGTHETPRLKSTRTEIASNDAPPAAQREGPMTGLRSAVLNIAPLGQPNPEDNQQIQQLKSEINEARYCSQLHPERSRILALWKVYIDSVDPVIKVLHVPTTQQHIFEAIQDIENTPADVQALMFAVYCAAIISMRYSVSSHTLPHDERQQKLYRYSTGLQHALARSQVLERPSLLAMQAFTLYLVCARYSIDGTYVWSMTGLLTRLGMTLGIHRNATTNEMSSLETEMRRRLWWHVFMLDVLTAEDNNTDPTIYDHMFDTDLPADADDAEVTSGTIRTRNVGSGHTELLFTLARIRSVMTMRKIVFSTAFSAANGQPNLSKTDKATILDNLSAEVQEMCRHKSKKRPPINFFTVTFIENSIERMRDNIGRRDDERGRVGYNDILRKRNPDDDAIPSILSDFEHNRWAWLIGSKI